MAITVKLRAPREPEVIGSSDSSPEAHELAKLVQRRELFSGTPVRSPGEMFAVLLAMGFKRGDRLDVQSRAREFVTHMRQVLQAEDNRKATLDELIDMMAYLGYTRALVGSPIP